MKEVRSQREVMAGFSLPEDEIDLSRDCKKMIARKEMGMSLKMMA